MDDRIMKQLTDSIEKLGNKFDDFGNRLTKIETMFSMFDKSQTHLANKVDDVEKVANESLASTKAAHKRLDGMEEDVEIASSIPDHAKRIDKLEKVVFWVGTTVIGALIVGAIGLLFTGIGGK